MQLGFSPYQGLFGFRSKKLIQGTDNRSQPVPVHKVDDVEILKQNELHVRRRKDVPHFEIPAVESIPMPADLPFPISTPVGHQFPTKKLGSTLTPDLNRVVSTVESVDSVPSNISIPIALNLCSSIDEIASVTVEHVNRTSPIKFLRQERQLPKPMCSLIKSVRSKRKKLHVSHSKLKVHKCQSPLQIFLASILHFISVATILKFLKSFQISKPKLKGQKLQASIQLARNINLPLRKRIKILQERRRKMKKKTFVFDLQENEVTFLPLLVDSQIHNVGDENNLHLYTPVKFGSGVNQIDSQVQLDSGSSTNLMGKNLALSLIEKGLINYMYAEQTIDMYDVQKNLILQPLNPINIDVSYGTKVIPTRFQVVESLDYPLLGLGSMINANMSIVSHNNDSYLYVGDITNPDSIVKNFTTSPNDILLMDDVHILPGINKISCVSSMASGVVEIKNNSDFEDTCLYVPMQYITIKDYQINMLAYNLSENVFNLLENTNVAQIMHVSIPEVVNMNVCSSIETKTHYDSSFEDEGDERFTFPLPDKQGEELLEAVEPYSIPLIEEKFDFEKDLSVNGVFPSDFLNDFISFIKDKTPNIFAKSEYDCGTLDKKYGFIEELPLTSDIPISAKPYRLNTIRAAQVKSTFEKLEKMGLVVKGHSPYATPVLLVPKADNRLRLVCDYRRLNANLETSNQPIPRIDSLLQLISDSKPTYFSTFDISQAFSSVQLGKKAQMQASIVTNENQYLPTRLNFGLKISPSFFIQCLQKVFSELPKDGNTSFCTFYFDDIVVFSKTKEEHLKHIKTVFELLHKVGLKLQPSKNNFFKKRIELLGKVITGTTISPMPKHVASLKRFPKPTSVKTVQMFLGLLTWNCNLIPDYSQTIQPITKLLRKDVKFYWGPEQDACFTYIKELLTEFTVQYFIDYSLPLYLISDASINFISGILYQVKSYSKSEIPDLLTSLEYTKDLRKLPDPKFPTPHPLLPKNSIGIPTPFQLTTKGIASPHNVPLLARDALTENLDETNVVDNLEPFLDSSQCLHIVCNVGFYSSSLTKSQSSYSIIELEALAVISSLTFFKPLLQGSNELYVLSDSRPFLFIMKLMRCGISRLQRWSIKLFSLPYNLIMVHIKGEANYADSFSRVWKVIDSEEDMPNMKKPVVVHSPFRIGQLITYDDLLNALNNNPDLVSFTPKEKKPNICKVDVSTIKYVGSKLVVELEKIISTSEIMKYQQEDGFCRHLSPDKIYYKFRNTWYKKRKNQMSLDESGRIIVPRCLVSAAIGLMHVENHCGVDSLYSQIKSLYFFPNMFQTVREFIQLCHLCAIYKACTQPKIPLAKRELDPAPKCAIWSIDQVDGLVETRGISGSFLSMVEYHSGFRIVVPLKNTTSAEIAKIIEKDLIANFGVPLLIVSDGGTNLLKSKNVKRLLNFYGTQSHISSAYHPASHGRIEVSHQAILSLLKMTSETLGKPWYELCSFVQLALNSRPSKILGGKSPNYVMFGFETDYRRKGNFKLSDIPDISEQKLIWKNHDVACDKILREYNVLRNKWNEKIGGKIKTYQKGDFVLAKNFTKSPKMKMRSKYMTEPLEVVKDFGYAILAQNNLGVIFKLHKNNIKFYPQRNLEMFNALPLKIQLQLNGKFDGKDLEKYYNELNKEEAEIIIPNQILHEGKNENTKIVPNSDEVIDSDESEVDSDDERIDVENNLPELKIKASSRRPDQPLHMNLRKRVQFQENKK